MIPIHLLLVLMLLCSSGNDSAQLLLQTVVWVFPSDSRKFGNVERDNVGDTGEDTKSGKDL